MAETIRETYIRRNPRSAALFPRFQQYFPSGGGGHDGYVADPFPVTIERGQGPRKWDVDGNEYIDYGLGSASLLLGHSHPEVVEALMQAAPAGSHYGSPVEKVLEWGERVCNMVPCADKVRFVGSGAEATALALRIARAFSGKDKIVRWESHYHGWHDYVMPGNLAPFDVPASTGIPKGTVDSVVVLPPDLDALERVLATDNDIAGVITEGSGASYGTVPLAPGFVTGREGPDPALRRGDGPGRSNHRFPLEYGRSATGLGNRPGPLHHGQDSHRRPSQEARWPAGKT